MDELDLIRALRDNAPDERAREVAHRALRARIEGAASASGAVGEVGGSRGAGGSREVGGSRGAGGSREVGGSRRAGGPERGGSPAAAGPQRAGGPPRSRLRRRARWAAPAAALAAVAALAFAFLPAGDRDSGGGAPFAPATAQAALERAADIAQDGADRPLKPGEYFYVRDRSAYITTSSAEGGTWSALVPTERETWTARDGRGRFAARDTGDPVFPGPRDRANWEAEGSAPLTRSIGPAAGTTFDMNGFGAGGTVISYAQLAGLPADGEAMYRKLVELGNGAGPSPDVEAFVIIGDLLRSAPVPADVRAGLYRAAAHIKGVRYAGEVTDALGRKGPAIELDHAGERRRLVFDAKTSQLLGEQEVLTKRVPHIDADPGFVMGYRLVLEQGIVASDTARP